MQVERAFKGVWIPKEVWLDDNLTFLDKVILVELDSLDNDDGCYASNEYLAEFCKCSIRKVSAAVAKLQRLGYLQVIEFDGRRRKLHVLLGCLAKSARLSSKKCEAESQKMHAINIVNKKENNSPYSPPKGDEIGNLISPTKDSSKTVENSKAPTPQPVPTPSPSRPTEKPQEKQPPRVYSSSESGTRRYTSQRFEQKYPQMVPARDRVVEYLQKRGIIIHDMRKLNRDVLLIGGHFVRLDDYEEAAKLVMLYINYLESEEYQYQLENAKSCPRITKQDDLAIKFAAIREFKNDPNRHFDPTTQRRY